MTQEDDYTKDENQIRSEIQGIKGTTEKKILVSGYSGYGFHDAVAMTKGLNSNKDAVYIGRDCFGVADGVSSDPLSGSVSADVIESLVLVGYTDPVSFIKYIERQIQSEFSNEDGQIVGATTLVSGKVVEDQGELYLEHINIGDSQLRILRGDKVIKPDVVQTFSGEIDRYVNDALKYLKDEKLEFQDLPKFSYFTHLMKFYLSNEDPPYDHQEVKKFMKNMYATAPFNNPAYFIGNLHRMIPDMKAETIESLFVRKIPIEDGDRIVMYSDGIDLTDHELLVQARSNKDNEDFANSLMESRAYDDKSVLVLKIDRSRVA